MRRNARIRWPGSEFKSSHRGRRSKEVRNIGKLFNLTAICLNINFNKNLSKANSPSSRRQLSSKTSQPGKDFILRSKHWPTTVSDRTLVKRGYLFHPQRDALFESYIYGSRITATYCAAITDLPQHFFWPSTVSDRTLPKRVKRPDISHLHLFNF